MSETSTPRAAHMLDAFRSTVTNICERRGQCQQMRMDLLRAVDEAAPMLEEELDRGGLVALIRLLVEVAR